MAPASTPSEVKPSARVQAVGYQRRRANFAPHANAENRDQLVAQKADDGRRRDPAQIAQRLWMSDSLDRLVEHEQRTTEDHQHNQRPGQVLGAAVAVGVAAVASAAGQRERQPERDGRQGVRKVVRRVGQQCHTAADRHHADLKERRDQQAGQRQFERADAARRG